MSESNIYKVGSVEYYEYELKAASLNLELVTEAAAARIKSSTRETACEVTMEMCKAITNAIDRVSLAEFSLKQAGGATNENH